jgi:SNF2 family DNA or RNA helicase
MLQNAELYTHQDDAVDRMLERKSLLVAHDMGLGKTVTTIAAIEELIDSGEVEQVLVICPASVKWQWAKAVKKFTDGGLVKVIDGNKNERWAQYRILRRGEIEYTIMNYEQVVSDWDTLRHFAWDAVICDEITYIKSPQAKRTRHVRRIDAPYKFGLSGQPIENRPEELYHIMRWIDPDVLGRADVFDKLFVVRNQWGGVKHYKNLKHLRDLMQEAMHRKKRSDPDVKANMPTIVEEEYIVDMDAATQKVYDRIARELVDSIRGSSAYSSWNIMDHYSGTGEGWMNADVMPRLMALRMLCDHPLLLGYSADLFDDPDSVAGSQYASKLRQTGHLDRIGKGSPKLAATVELINEILSASDRNKIVLFSFFKPMLTLIGEQLKVKYEYFTGDFTTQEREAARDRFNDNPDCRVLLSSDAGGIGVDLPAANYLISYDLPWSAGKLKQREARIDRISTEWDEITLIKMVMKDSIEEWMLDQLMQKVGVAGAFIDGGYDKSGNYLLTAQGLADFLEEHL